MENKYIIKISNEAKNNLESIFVYLKNEVQNAEIALKVINRIEKSILRLEQFPYACNFVNKDILKEKGYRKLIVDNYIVYYLVNEENQEVNVISIMYGVRSYEKLI